MSVKYFAVTRMTQYKTAMVPTPLCTTQTHTHTQLQHYSIIHHMNMQWYYLFVICIYWQITLLLCPLFGIQQPSNSTFLLSKYAVTSITDAKIVIYIKIYSFHWPTVWWLGNRVVSMLDSGAEGPGFKSQPWRCSVTVLGKLFTPIIPLFTKQWNW